MPSLRLKGNPLLALLVTFGLVLSIPALAELPAPKMGADGMYTEPWFNASSQDLRKDVAAAKAEGKILAILWEQVGCTYCREMHMTHFRNEVIVDYINKNFYVIKLDMRGEGQIIDLDGKTMSEAEMSRRHTVNGTPNIEFRDADGKEVFRMPGYVGAMVFYGILDYVVNGGYEIATLGGWLSQLFANGNDPLSANVSEAGG